MATQDTETTTSSTVSDELIEELNRLLSDYQVLYQKLRAYHWNVEGSDFFRLHEKFEELYNTVTLQVDEIAERIRALGEYPVSTYSEQLVEARISEDNGQIDAQQMVKNLCSDYENLQGALGDAAELAGDEGDTTTVNLLEDIQDGQEETIWMLKAYLS
jgi:starvation-inducible DNA-binding protein